MLFCAVQLPSGQTLLQTILYGIFEAMVRVLVRWSVHGSPRRDQVLLVCGKTWHDNVKMGGVWDQAWHVWDQDV